MEFYTSLYLPFVVLLSMSDLLSSLPLFDIKKVGAKPNNVRKFQLYSRLGYYLAINDNGQVYITLKKENPDTRLVLESYSRSHRRIKTEPKARIDIRSTGPKSTTSYYLAIDKNGKIRTRRMPRKDTVFIEKMGEDSWVRYKNNHTGFTLMIKPKDKHFKHPLKKGKHHKRKSGFLTLLL